jgi:hypothetical protein
VISPKALGLLLYIYTHGAVGGSEGLSRAFGVGRRYVLEGIKELRSEGFVDLIKGRDSHGHYWSEVLLTRHGFEEVMKYTDLDWGKLPKLSTNHPARGAKKAHRRSAKSAPYIEQNSYLANYPNSKDTNSIRATKYTDGVRDDEEEYSKFDIEIRSDMSFYGDAIDPDDLKDLIAKDRARKQKEYDEAKAEKMKKKFVHRNETAVEKWTLSDSASYFAELVSNQWKMKPWNIYQSRFKFALSNFRKAHATNGAEEKELMDRFFATVVHETKLDDPEAIWKMFIKRAPSMITELRRHPVSEDDMVTAKIKAEEKGPSKYDV